MTSQGGSVIEPRLARGRGFLVPAPDGGALAFLQSLSGSEDALLWITDRTASPALDDIEVLRVTSLPGRPGTLDAKRLQDLRSVAADFLTRHGQGAIVVDCVDVLILHNGVERAVRALEDLHEEVVMRGAALVLLVDPRTTNPRALAWLERELDSLPGPSGPRPLEDRLPA